MGSDSDLPVLANCARTLDTLGISYHMTVLSAHRTANQLSTYIQATQDTTQIYIAAAGGAAHLPGVIAALTHRPIIGIPIQTPGLGGLDSLLSTAQMPPGIPVATVGIDAAKNAGLLAVKILATSY